MTFRPSSVRDTRRVVFDELPRVGWWTAKVEGAAEPDHSRAQRLPDHRGTMPTCRATGHLSRRHISCATPSPKPQHYDKEAAMPHYKRMYDDKEHIYAFDLDGRDVTLTIEAVRAGEVQGEQGRKSKKPIIKFAGKDKKLAVNKTNGKIIAQLYGTNTEDWVGKAVTLFPTTTNFGGETVECIRVRPQRPEQRANGQRGSKGGGPQREAQTPGDPDDAEAAEIRAMEAKQQS